VASGIALGFAFAMGGIGTAITGFLAEPERLGLSASLMMLAVLPLACALLALTLPDEHGAVAQPARAGEREQQPAAAK
jgi:FSR family fosmidomycin resistance protein-like MFS transporter